MLRLENVKYLTVHKAKGLESEVVIIINLKDSYNGFPSKIKENKVLEKQNFIKSEKQIDDGYGPENEYFYYFDR